MNSVLQTTPALDEFRPETTASLGDPFSPPAAFDPGDADITRQLDISFRKFHWLVSMLAILFAGYLGFERIREAQSAAEQAAGAAITLMIAVVPYLFAKSVDEFRRPINVGIGT